jgi:uncharacterized DUF497 family protein
LLIALIGDTNNGGKLRSGEAGCEALNRGLDFAEAEAVFEGRSITVQEPRMICCDDRFITAGHLAGLCVVLFGRRAKTDVTLSR